MPAPSDAIRAALRADLRVEPSGWAGALKDEAQRHRFESALADFPVDVQDAVLASLLDPQQHLWACGAVLALQRLQQAGASVVGMAHDEVIELTDERGLAFGLAPVGMPGVLPWGDPDSVERLLAALDVVFGERAYVVHLGRPIPAFLDEAAVARAVRLWLSELGPGDHEGLQATYEDDHVAIDFILGPAHQKGRQLTVGPLRALERLNGLEGDLIEVMARHEQGVGDLPLVVVLTADHPWGLPRGYVQLHLYGPTREVVATSGEPAGYEAWFPTRGSAMFHDRMFQNLAALWWLSPQPEPEQDLLASRAVAYDNPWARVSLQLDLAGPRFACADLEDGTAHLRWRRA